MQELSFTGSDLLELLHMSCECRYWFWTAAFLHHMIMGKITQKARWRMSMLSPRMKARNLKWRMKVTKIGQATMKNLVKVMMRMLSNLWKT